MMELVKQIIKRERQKSTCQKRAVVCLIYDREDRLIGYGSNKCEPEGGVCGRLGVVQNQMNYDLESSCNWTHAEIDAIGRLIPNSQPFRAIAYGHSFFCIHCKKALMALGVERMECYEEFPDV